MGTSSRRGRPGARRVVSMGGCAGKAKLPPPAGKPIALILQFVDSGEQRVETVYLNQPISELQRRLIPRLAGQPASEWEAQSEALTEMRYGETDLALQLPLHLVEPPATMEHDSLEFSQSVLLSDALWGKVGFIALGAAGIVAGTSVYVQDDIWRDLYATEVERVEAAECDLITACQANELAVLERVLTLLPERALEENAHKNNLLHEASRASRNDSHLRLVELLIAHDTQVTTANQWEYLPLHYCGWTGDNPKLCQVLLDAGASVNAKNINGRTALHFAQNYKHMETVEVLRNAPAYQCC